MFNDYENGGSPSPYRLTSRSPTALLVPYVPLSTSFPHYPATSSSTQCSFDLLKGKVEHLENERVNLSLQMQEQSEKDRTRKIRIEQLETDLKISNSAQLNLKRTIDESQLNIKILTDEKDDLKLEIEKLNERVEAQAKEASGAQNFWSKMTAAHRELKRLEDDALKYRMEKADWETDKANLCSEISKLSEMNERRLEEMTLLRLEIEGQRRTFKDSKNALESTYLSTSKELQSLKRTLQETIESKDNIEEHSLQERRSLLEEIIELKNELADRPPAISNAEGEGLENILDCAMFDELKKKLLESEMKRKALHNTLQELRGNIRVFVRCRPFLSGDGEENSNLENVDPNTSGCVKFLKDGTSVSLSASAKASSQVFTFDQVFKCESTQLEVYNEVSDLVQSALDGYKVCIFSYGQTGSGSQLKK